MEEQDLPQKAKNYKTGTKLLMNSPIHGRVLQWGVLSEVSSLL